MAEVTAKATFIGALILFLIGLVVATLLNYAEPSVNSIAAGLDGPFDCDFEYEDRRDILCNETDFLAPQDCLYYYVKYYNKKEHTYTAGIKLSKSYLYERLETISRHRIRYGDGGEEVLLGKCSADYCGNYRFKTESGEYRKHPDLVEVVEEARVNGTGVIPCFINPSRPADGAYLHLNAEVERAEHRMFRYYEAWIILVLPVVVLVVIIVTICVLFIRGDLAARPVQRKKEAFARIPPTWNDSAARSPLPNPPLVPPGFQQVPTSAQGSTKSSTRETLSKPVPV